MARVARFVVVHGLARGSNGCCFSGQLQGLRLLKNFRVCVCTHCSRWQVCLGLSGDELTTLWLPVGREADHLAEHSPFKPTCDYKVGLVPFELRSNDVPNPNVQVEYIVDEDERRVTLMPKPWGKFDVVFMVRRRICILAFVRTGIPDPHGNASSPSGKNWLSASTLLCWVDTVACLSLLRRAFHLALMCRSARIV